ncbi:MAG: alpha/beta hydrolase fold protein [Myxococcales bacterium]|nr:alpha/beta hydrolase fold protein [Myxococcales bacterium]
MAGGTDARAAFDLVGDDELGVVLVHGFTGTPFEVRYLGERLAQAGFTVHAPRLPGHGTRVEDLDATRWQDWAGAVDRAVDALQQRCRRVAVVGQSLGGLLALHLASRRTDIACVASLAAPLWLEGLSAKVARWTRPGGVLQRVRTIPKLGGSDVRDPRAKAANPCYDAIPTRALGELMAFMKITEDALPAVTQPLLVLHATQDHTAPVACATRIAKRARAVRMRILPRSYHLIAVDVERDIVAAEVIQFLKTSGGTPCAT